MKPGIHPDYHPVVFQDANTGAMFLTRSTMTSSRTIEWETPQACAPTRSSSLKSLQIHTRSGPAGAASSTAPDK
jgi:ribosomal protein L31